MNPHLDDTIVAISTPAGRGGIGVVRLSGERAVEIAGQLVRAGGGAAGGGAAVGLRAGRAVVAYLTDAESGERIDEVVVTYFAKPHSYTTEDVVEISAHGSPVVLRHMVEAAMQRGARLAEPGEFTMRAFLRGRLDLTQAEAVADLIESQTLFQAKAAAQQLQGALAKRLQPIKQRLCNLIAVLEAGVDFAEDDVAVLADEEIAKSIAMVREPLAELAASFAYGRMVHEGITLAIVGRPNVGKSSLFNRLVEREHAIVTATPGTTRDLVSETVSLNGIPVKLTDTAGIRTSSDEAESIGIRKSYEALADADLVLMVVDAREVGGGGLQGEDLKLWKAAEAKGQKAMVVANKADLAEAKSGGEGQVKVWTSAVRGDGIRELREEIMKRMSGEAAQMEAGYLTNARQQGNVNEALTSLDKAAGALAQRVPHEMLLLDLYCGLRPLDAITGETSTDDILNLIFSSFCIGK